MKKIASIVLSAIVAVLMIVITVIGIIGVGQKHQMVKCTGISVDLLDSSELKYITAEQICKIIDREYGGYRNRPVSRIKTREIESLLESQPCIKRGSAYFTNDGILHIEVLQRTPWLEIEHNGSIYYVDIEGNCIKVRQPWMENLLKMNGPAFEQTTLWKRRAAAFARWIYSHSQWSTMVNGMSCDKKGNISIRLEGMDEIFIIGQPTAVKDKMKRVRTYLEKIEPNTDKEKNYKTVNVKYNGQIVCK